jgi:hypothetical protein
MTWFNLWHLGRIVSTRLHDNNQIPLVTMP